VTRLAGAPSVGHIVIAAPVGMVDAISISISIDVAVGLTVVEGGPSRQQSVATALAAVPATYQIVLVHDAARAFAPVELIERVAAAVRDGRPAVIPVLPLVDTIKVIDDSGHVVDTLNRSALRAVQTPHGFRRDVLEAAHRNGVDGGFASAGLTDDAGLVEKLGVPVYCVPGSEAALKITRPADLAVAETFLP